MHRCRLKPVMPSHNQEAALSCLHCSMDIALMITTPNSARCLTFVRGLAQLSIMPGRKKRKPGQQAAEMIGHLMLNSLAHHIC